MKTLVEQLSPVALAASLLAATVPLSAPATVYSYSSVQPETRAEWSYDFVLPKFDTALGSLDAVRITADYDITTSGVVSNTDQSSKVFWFQAGSLLTLELPGTLGLLDVSPFADEVHYKLPGHTSATYGTFSTNGSVQITLTGAATAPFMGTGSLEFPSHTTTQELLKDIVNGGGGKIDVSLVTNAGATLTVEYFDNPVPEPSARALLFVALGMIPLLLRQRR